MSLNDLIKQYIKIKETGTPCSVKEARKFFYDVFKSSKEKYVQVLGLELLNFNQNIPITKVDEESLEMILDDLDYIQEQAITLETTLQLAWDLYHHPENYNAWKGEIEGETVYYVELKTRKKEEELNELYI